MFVDYRDVCPCPLDPLKQATERARKGKEMVGSTDTYVNAPLSTAIPIHISNLNLSLIWSKTDYAATLTTV
jgi:hypothetical protein